MKRNRLPRPVTPRDHANATMGRWKRTWGKSVAMWEQHNCKWDAMPGVLTRLAMVSDMEKMVERAVKQATRKPLPVAARRR